jgi:hypothetical protein
MGLVDYSPTLTFDSGAHQKLKASRQMGAPDSVRTEIRLSARFNAGCPTSVFEGGRFSSLKLPLTTRLRLWYITPVK